MKDNNKHENWEWENFNSESIPQEYQSEGCQSEECQIEECQSEEYFIGGDRFELLSAYLDSELCPKQRQEVEHWLEVDPCIQEMHSRLLKLRQAMTSFETIPIPETQSSEELCQSVFEAIDEGKRKRKLWLIGAGAIAAVVVGAVASIFEPFSSPRLQFAKESEPLLIGINHPPIEFAQHNSNPSSDSLNIPLNRPLFDVIEN